MLHILNFKIFLCTNEKLSYCSINNKQIKINFVFETTKTSIYLSNRNDKSIKSSIKHQSKKALVNTSKTVT